MNLPYCVPNLSIADYHALLEFLSNSGFSAAARSWWHFEHRGDSKEKKTCYEQGDAGHAGMLEPKRFDEFFVRGYADRRGNKWKELVAENYDKTVLTESDYDAVAVMRDAIQAHPEARELLKKGKVEQSYFWVDRETEQQCRVRPDFETPIGDLADLKFVADGCAERDKFIKDYIEGFGYYRQAAYYLDGVNAYKPMPNRKFFFVVVEKKPPHLVNVIPCGDEHLIAGREEYKYYLRKIDEYETMKRTKPDELHDGYPLQMHIESEPTSWFHKRMERFDD